MPPLDAWLEITIRIPSLLLPVLVLLLIALIAGGAIAYRRRQQKAQPASAEEAYRHFIYHISHEVAKPLQSIQTSLDNMARYGTNQAGRWRQHHAIITDEIRRLSRLLK